MSKMRASLGVFSLSASLADYLLTVIPIQEAMYLNHDLLAAAVWADGDVSRYTAALSTIGLSDQTDHLIAMYSYTKKISRSQTLAVTVDLAREVHRNNSPAATAVMLGVSVPPTGFNESTPTAPTVNLAVLSSFNLEFPKILGLTDATETQLMRLVELGLYIPDLRPRKIYLDEMAGSLVLVGSALKLSSRLDPAASLLYMKWCISVATEWNVFPGVYDLLSSNPGYLEDVLGVARSSTTLRALNVNKIDLEDLTELFDASYPVSLTAPLKPIPWRSIGGELFALVPGFPFELSQTAARKALTLAREYLVVTDIIATPLSKIEIATRTVSFMFVESTPIEVTLEAPGAPAVKFELGESELLAVDTTGTVTVTFGHETRMMIAS